MTVAEGQEKEGLRRAVGVWGSFTWGYADVRADVYVALGLVVGAARGGTPAAFAMTGLIYLFIGLAYTELAATYPVARLHLWLGAAARLPHRRVALRPLGGGLHQLLLPGPAEAAVAGH
ncbi:MAG: hypothetical protein ACYC9Q_01655 [Bacillota bacterium]